jgi:sulfate adenylyltransferase
MSRLMEPGVCVWLTGRSGAGKTTLVRALLPLLDAYGRTYSLLDTVPALAKQRWERNSEPKLMRKAYVASEIVRHGGIAICVTVSASQQVRDAARQLVGADHFLEVYIDVPADVAAARKASRGRKVPVVKRARAFLRRIVRRGAVGAAYEVPVRPDVVLEGAGIAPEVAARQLIDVLVERGFLAAADTTAVAQ